jgi:hypothetical protein
LAKPEKRFRFLVSADSGLWTLMAVQKKRRLRSSILLSIAVSAMDHFILSFAQEFIPIANARGVATIGMKVLGLGSLTHEVQRSLRYAFSLPLITVIVGMETMAQLEQNMEIAASFTPLTDEERLSFFKDIIYFKP